MKIACIFFALAACFSMGLAQEQTPVRMTYQTGIKLDSVPTPGYRFVFKQQCTTQLDSIITTGNISFLHSKVGRVKDCTLEWKIVHDTLAKIRIDTYSPKQTQRLVKQFLSQYGTHYELMEGVDFLHYRFTDADILAVLFVSEDKTNGGLVVQRISGADY